MNKGLKTFLTFLGIVAFIAFGLAISYFNGLGSRRTANHLETLVADMDLRIDELEERLDEIDTAIEELDDTIFHETDNREMYGEWTEGELQDLHDSVDELKEEINRLKTG